MRWNDFCDAIDLVFTKKNLEKENPTEELTFPSTVYQYGKKPLGE